MRNSSILTLRSWLLAVLITGIAACDTGTEEQAKEPIIRPVKMITLSPASDVETRRYPAIVSAGQYSDLSFQVGGRIETVSVSEAQDVLEGDAIAQLEQRDFLTQLNSARSQFQNAEDEYQRAVRLSEQDAIARSVLEQRRTQRDVARAQLDSAEKALEDTVLRAPFSGVIVQLPARENESVTAGTPVASIMGSDALEVSIDLPASVIAQSLEVEDRGAFVILEAASDTRIPAEFEEANLLADSASQTYRVVFAFEPPENLVILPGMNATVELASARVSGGPGSRISVPLTAIASDGASKYVWLVDADSMRVSRRTVTVADGIGQSAVITEGLESGDTIATAGASFLAEGMQVRPWTE